MPSGNFKAGMQSLVLQLAFISPCSNICNLEVIKYCNTSVSHFFSILEMDTENIRGPRSE